MNFKQGKTCPICQKEHLFYLSDHLRQVHRLSSKERKPLFKSAVFSPSQSNGLPFIPAYPFFGMQQYPRGMEPQLTNDSSHCRIQNRTKAIKVQSMDCLETQSYPEFLFQHMFSMLVVGPSQCGKTYFVQQLLTKKCIEFPEKKPSQVYWFYNQWQSRYDEIKQVLKKKIQFAQGLPELSEDLHEINPELNNILVFDDLMAQAADSPVLSRLFTQGRHRNASVILLLQNMFPKGKFNTDISRNALYKVLFRSLGDRKQIDIMAEQTFAKDRTNFMKAYTRETEKPFGYIILDNHPRTSSENQVVANVFCDCYTYPYITKTEGPSPQSKVSPSPQNSVSLEVQPKLPVKRKAEDQITGVKKQKKSAVKHKVKREYPVVRKQKKPSVKRKPVKKSQKRIKSRKQTTYHSNEKFTGGFPEEEISSEETEEDESNIRTPTFEEELIQLALQPERTGYSSRGVGLRIH